MGGWARASVRALLDYGAARPPDVGPAEGLTASSMPLFFFSVAKVLVCFFCLFMEPNILIYFL